MREGNQEVTYDMKNDMLRYRKVYDLSEESHFKWRWGLGAVGTLIILINLGGWWRLATLVALWSILEIDYLINFVEELQLKKYSGLSDLIQRWLILWQVKKLLDDEVDRIVGVYQYGRGGKIKVPFVNVYVNHSHGFKGQIEIELLPEFNSFLNSETINTQLTSQLKYLNRNYVVTDVALSPTGNSMIYTLNDVQADNQIKIQRTANIVNHEAKVILDQNHIIDWDQEYHGVVSGTTGSGKTMLIEYLIANAKKNGWDIVILDPKQSDLAKIKNTKQIIVADQKDQMLKVLHDTVKEMQEVQRRYKENTNIQLVPHLVVVDELAALKSMLDRKEQQQLLNDLKQLALLGRQAKFHLLVGVQQANANNIPTEIREQLGIKILLGNSTPSARKFLFEDCIIEVPLGNAVGQGLISINDGPVSPFKAPLIQTDLIEAINQPVIY